MPTAFTGYLQVTCHSGWTRTTDFVHVETWLNALYQLSYRMMLPRMALPISFIEDLPHG